jgi:hypothetical protein
MICIDSVDHVFLVFEQLRKCSKMGQEYIASDLYNDKAIKVRGLLIVV